MGPCYVCAQTNINSEGFRSLREGEAVEFEVEAGPDGRAKAVNVTGPQGGVPEVSSGNCGIMCNQDSWAAAIRPQALVSHPAPSQRALQKGLFC